MGRACREDECMEAFGGKNQRERDNQENDIKMDLREIEWVTWTGLIRLRRGISELWAL
jgi:hypothetical protein